MTGLNVPKTWQDVDQAVQTLSDKKVLFVTGAVKSGTTWTQLWLDSHPEIACRGEGYFFNKFAGALQHLCNETSELIGKQNERKGLKIPDFPTLDLPVVQYLLRQSVLSCLSAYGNAPSLRVVAEKTPSTILAMEAVFLVFPEAQVLNCVRDGRDVCLSAWYDNLRKGGDQFLNVFPTLDAFLPNIAQIWVNHHQPAVKTRAERPDQFRQIYYEDLVTDPEPVLHRVFDWLAVDGDAQTVRHCLEATRFETLSEGRKPGEEDRRSFFRKGTAGQWRTEMTETQEALFWSIAGPTMEAQGYRRDGTRAA